MVQTEMPKWKASSFMGIDYENEREFLDIEQEQLIALAYLKHIRTFVVKKGFSYMASFDGRHRSGKSLAAVTFGCLWDESFWKYFELRVVQDHKEFMNAIENIAKEEIKGAVIVVDEAGISMGSSDWYEKWMKTLTKTVQMFGYLYPIILFVAPVKSFVDSRLRKMFHAYYKVDRNNTEYSIITPYDIKFSSIRSKEYYPKPIIKLGNQEIAVKRIILKKPPKEIIDRYRNLEKSRKTKLLAGFMEEIRRSDVKKEREQVDLEQVIASVISNHVAYESKRSKPHDVELDVNKIEFRLKVPNRMAKYIKSEAERKLNAEYNKLKKEMEAGVKNAK